jgi:hypothetical protein
MVKKSKKTSQKKPIRRTSTMAKVVAEGEKFLAQTKKKKATRTTTMDQTIKEGH